MILLGLFGLIECPDGTFGGGDREFAQLCRRVPGNWGKRPGTRRRLRGTLRTFVGFYRSVGQAKAQRTARCVKYVILISLVSDGSELVRLEGQLRSSVHLG
jgi:hypothetical protein